ncbi:HAD domain-containing protein [Kribbella sp. NPDC023972]|uniref:HAD domain-containing protein n=1 Tax=Kribbella sp. NPDC023972 TaxID=3154795 RepID=UPI0033CB09B5
MRPLLLLDFDGPLNPHRAQGIPVGYDQHEIVEGARSWAVLLNPRHGVELNALAEVFDLVWATSWEHGANRLLAPRLGLPELPVIVWPARAPVRRGSWKTAYVAEWVGERPFVWVDDEVGRDDQLFFGGDHQLVHCVDARTGLTAADFAAIRAWAVRNSFAEKAFRPHP